MPPDDEVVGAGTNEISSPELGLPETDRTEKPNCVEKLNEASPNSPRVPIEIKNNRPDKIIVS